MLEPFGYHSFAECGYSIAARDMDFSPTLLVLVSVQEQQMKVSLLLVLLPQQFEVARYRLHHIAGDTVRL